MSILFSRQCEYALQALMFLALQDDHRSTPIKELTERLDIPYHFVAKTLQSLTHKGLLVSHKGPSGGFALAKPAEQITLMDIIEAIDGGAFMKDCILGFEQCSKENPCSLHDQWQSSREGIAAMLRTKSISEMAGRMKKPQYQA
jgi:Rrf2 family transcriptional regulator, iron-sulfur cluster assembly transcription factor